MAVDHNRFFTGTAAIKKDLTWCRGHSEGFDIDLEDDTMRYATLGLMGPNASRIAKKIGAPELNNLENFKLGTAQVAGKDVWAARLSYVGETGWEITCRSENAKPIYDAITDASATPAGLYAQMSMRIEKGFCAMGHELDGDVYHANVTNGLLFDPSGNRMKG